MEKIINCGKIDWNHTGRKINSVELELKLTEKNGHYGFSCCASIWNNLHTDIIAGGQCLDELFKYPQLNKYKEIYELWKKYHLNDMKAGSPRQEEAIENWMIQRRNSGKSYNYEEVCNMLKHKNLFIDELYIYKNKPYKYGTAWLIQDIPEEDLMMIKKWIET